MAKASGSALTSVYETRIGTETNANEAMGYWAFVVGVSVGFLGILLVMVSNDPGATLRGAGIALASLGLLMLLIGPVVRLPLQGAATKLSYLGAVIGLLAIAWFTMAFPDRWGAAFENQEVWIIGLYGLGVLVVALGGVFVPLMGGSTEEQEAAEDRAATAEAERDAAIEEAEERGRQATEAEHERVAAVEEAEDERDAAVEEAEDERAAEVAALETELAAREREIEELQSDLADEKTDRDTLAAVITDLRTSESQFELYEDRGEQWRWRLRHESGNVIAASNTGYDRQTPAQTGIQAVRRDALGATTLIVESEDELPEEGTSDGLVLPDHVESKAAFELYVGKGDDHRWRLRHDNGEIIANAAQGYASRSGATHSIDRIREYVGPAEYLQPDPTAIEIYRDEEAKYRWRLHHRNGNILGGSGEGYANRGGAKQAIDRLREEIGDAEIEVYEDEDGEFRWRLEGGNEKVKFDSTGYESRGGATEAVDRVRTFLPEADLIDIGQAVFEVYEDEGGDHRWRIRHRNGNILANGTQGYASRTGVWDGIESVKRNAPEAPLEELGE